MINAPIDEISQAHFDQLLEEKKVEDYTIEFKENWPGKGKSPDADKLKLLEGICSFANSSDGDYLVGIATNKKGEVSEISGIAVENEDQTKLSLDNIIRSGVDPQFHNFFLRLVPLRNGKTVIVLRIRKSFTGPHRVKSNRRFMARGANGSFEIPVESLRFAFTHHQEIARQIRDFRAGRIVDIASGNTPFPMEAGAKLIFHLMPFSSFAENRKIDLREVEKISGINFHPLDFHGGNWIYNLEGFWFGSDLYKEATSYSQIFRNGVIECVELLGIGQGEKRIPQVFFERKIIEAFPRFVDGLIKLGIRTPFFVALAFVEVRDCFLASEIYLERSSRVVWRENLLVIPEIEITEFNEDAGILLKPLFDMVWNTFGFGESQNYRDGKWHPKV